MVSDCFFFFFWLHHKACGISISWSWIRPKHSALEAWITRHWAIREIPIFFFLFFKMNAEAQNNGNNWLLFFFFFNKCFWIYKAYTHLISHLSPKPSCWAGRADVSVFAPSFWEGGSDGASDLLSIAQLQKAVLRPFTKLSNSPSYGFFPSTVCLYVARKPQQPEVNQVTVKVRSSIRGTWPNSKFTGLEADRSGGMAVVQLLSHVQHFATPWTIARQAPLSIGFSRQKYWSGLPFLFPRDRPNPGIEPGLSHCRQILYHLSHQWS